jgi:hypothetical protein
MIGKPSAIADHVQRDPEKRDDRTNVRKRRLGGAFAEPGVVTTRQMPTVARPTTASATPRPDDPSTACGGSPDRSVGGDRRVALVATSRSEAISAELPIAA